ncbi:ArsR/SmtB family transcription factor [Fredinandcohnia humi]
MLIIESEYSPVYELLNSLFVFSSKNNYHDFGKSWVNDIKTKVNDSEFLSILEESEPFTYLGYMNVLIWKSPAKHDIVTFFEWLKNLKPGEIYEILSPYLCEGLPGELSEFRDHFLSLLSTWHQIYMIDEKLNNKLIEKSKLLNGEKNKYDPIDLIEELTNGIRIIPTQQTSLAVLVPSHHLTPLNFVSDLNNVIFITYAFDLPRDGNMIPQVKLSRMTRALGDEKRLQVLKLLAQKSYNLTELSKEIKISKSNLHYHLTLLRIAGLLRTVKDFSAKYERYEIRPNIFADLKTMLDEYVFGNL